MEAMHHALQHKVRCVFQRMKRLWRGKTGRWSGKLVIPSRTSWINTQLYEIEFTMVWAVGAVGRKMRKSRR